MYQQTSVASQTSYFTSKLSNEKPNYSFRRLLTLKKDHTDILFSFKQGVHLKEQKGLTLVILTDEPSHLSRYEYYLLTASIYIKPGVYFNTLSLTEESLILLEMVNRENPTSVRSPQPLHLQTYEAQIKLPHIYTSQQQTLQNQQTQMIRETDLYELIFVDSGTLAIELKEQTFELRDKQILILPPTSSSKGIIQAQKTSSYLSVYFSITGLEEEVLLKVLNLNPWQMKYLEAMIYQLNRDTISPYASDLLTSYLLSLLVTIHCKEEQPVQDIQTSMRDNYEIKLFRSIVEFLDKHVEEKNEVQDLVEAFDLSRSTLQTLFNKYAQMTPKQYINYVRLNRSKKLIRETTLTLSEIASSLGFGSIQYFSRAFKREFGMSPSNYAKSNLK